MVAPSMNTKMWEHPATQRNLKRVKSYGIMVIWPISKRLMCGDLGTGAMEEPEALAVETRKIVEAVTKSRHTFPVVTTYSSVAFVVIAVITAKLCKLF